jgi:hypothetical protein
VMNSINEYKFLDETWVRMGIFFHCMRGRLMMVIPLNSSHLQKNEQIPLKS